jgi:putative peptide zinc metalloprotease protein
MSLGKPLYTGLKHVISAPALRPHRRRATGITFGLIALATAFIAAIPMPLHTETEGVVWLPESSQVMAETDGFLQTVRVHPGESVKPGQVLFTLSDNEQSARVKLLQWTVKEMQLKLRQQLVSDPLEAKIAQLKLDEETSRLQREQHKLKQLDITSKRSGTFSPAMTVEDLAGRFFRKGELIGYVLPSDSHQLRLVVAQQNIDLVRESTLAVDLMLASDTRRTGQTQIVREVPAGQYELPSRALSQQGGGLFAIDPEDPQGNTMLNRIFQFDALLPEPLQGAPFGSRVLVRFEHAPEPLGFQFYRRVRQLFLSQFDA